MKSVMIEILDKQTEKTKEVTLRDYINSNPRGAGSKLKEVLDLCSGEVFQDIKTAVRVKGIQHTWEWEQYE